MAFTNIKRFLSKFNFPVPARKVMEKEVAEFLESSFSLLKGECQVEIKQPVVFIASTNPALKNEVYLHQAKILNKLKERFPTCSFQRIQFTNKTKAGII